MVIALLPTSNGETTTCPTASQRDLAGPGEPAGIAVLGEDLNSTAITSLETYLPASDC